MASRFVINNELEFTGDQIVSGSVLLEKATDLVGEELSADELQFSVFYDDTSNLLRNQVYGVTVAYYEEENAVGTFYLVNVSRTAAKMYTISAKSMVGILETQRHYGDFITNIPVRLAMEKVILTDGLFGTGYNVALRLDWITVVEATTVNTNLTTHFRDRVYSRFRLDKFFNALGKGAYVWGSGTVPYYCFVAQQNVMGTPKYAVGVRIGNNSYRMATFYTEAQLRDHTIYVDCRPVAGTLSITVGGGVYSGTFDISAEQSTYWYTNNSATLLNRIGSSPDTDCSEVIGVRTLWHEIYDQNGTQTFNHGTPFIYLATDKFRFNETIANIAVNANGVVDWRYRKNPTWTDAVPLTDKQIDMVENIVYLDGVENLTISGWLPIGTKRELLYQVIFAASLNLRTSTDGKLLVGGLSDSVVAEIPQANIYQAGTETPVEKTRKIFLTEHVYTQTSNNEVVFDNTGGTALNEEIVQFTTSPIKGAPTASGLTIKARNCNAAMVSGTGTLTGNVYAHGEIVHEYEVTSDIDGRDINVSSAYLVTLLNVDNVMDRLKAFYNNTVTKIDNAIVYSGEHCGNKYSFMSPFGDAVSAFLSKISAAASSFLKLNCTFYRNYTPPGIGSTYTHSVMLTGSGTWTRPSGVSEIRVILIGGGSGGSSGLAGENGFSPEYKTEVTAAINKPLGGAAGTNGSGGKIYDVTISSPSSSYSYSCGAGGSGGGACTSTGTANAGSAGGNTTFGSYSSSSGSSRTDGYTNLLSGERVGYTPTDYSSQMKGGDGGYIYKSGGSIVFVNGESVRNPFTGVSYTGGNSPAGGLSKGQYEVPAGTTYYSNSCGSGAAHNSNGYNGLIPYKSGYTYVGVPGQSAPGTSVPMSKAADTYGCGGYGGFGGAAAGSTSYYTDASDNKNYYYTGGGGYSMQGQPGGAGGKGANGCIIIFY